MKHRARLPIVLAATLLFAGSAPHNASAVEPGCTWNYLLCIAGNFEYPPILQELADIECFASYAGCVAGKLRRP